MKNNSAFELLSLREHDCLRLLCTGRQTSQVASDLGISLSTLHKHSASARRKLGVHRISQALLLCQHEDSASRQNASKLNHGVKEITGQSIFICDFIDVLQASETFDEAWAVFQEHLHRLGVAHLLFGVVAEPPGQLTNETRMFKICMPEGVTELYREAGGEKVDPLAPYVAQNKSSMFVDNEMILKTVLNENRNHLSTEMRRLGEAVIDYGGRFMLLQPERDTLTGAPFGACFVLDPQIARDVGENRTALTSHLHALVRIFCEFCQNRRMFSNFAGLTIRQCEALTLVARGFSAAEMAEHLSLSRRSVENLLASARDVLGVRTTSAALYRALVYRAIA